MTPEQISTIIERVARQFDIDTMPYTGDQLRDCVSAYGRLLDETGSSEYGRGLATSIFSTLAQHSEARPDPWEWIATELRFEAQVIAAGDRSLAATNYLRFRLQVNDQDLDLYNERVNRFRPPCSP